MIDGTLYIVGTDGCDIVLISQCSGTIYVCASFNDDNPMTFNSADVTDIEVRMRGGHDIVLTTSNVTQTMTIDGGVGQRSAHGRRRRQSAHRRHRDTTSSTAPAATTCSWAARGTTSSSAARATTCSWAATATTLLDGGTGRDLIIGSQDNDWLKGGDGEDILIGGVTIHDNNVAALDAVMAIWTSAASFNTPREHRSRTPAACCKAGVAVFDDDDRTITSTAVRAATWCSATPTVGRCDRSDRTASRPGRFGRRELKRAFERS